jgi:hyperosmotically inducible protein
MRVLKFALLASSVALAAAGTAAAQAPERFKSLDKDGDGFISKEEAAAVRGFDRAMAEADANRDGRLDPSEFTTAEAYHQRLEAGGYVSDSALTAKVKTALVRESGLKAMDVNVETYNGRVLLSGWVDSEEQRKKALNVARHVDGVIEVRDGMNVKN